MSHFSECSTCRPTTKMSKNASCVNVTLKILILGLFGLYENRFGSLHSFMCFMCAKSTYLKGCNTHSRWSLVVHLWPARLLQHHVLWCEYEQWRTLNMKPTRRFQDTLTAVKHGVWSHGKINIYDDNERKRNNQIKKINKRIWQSSKN